MIKMPIKSPVRIVIVLLARFLPLGRLSAEGRGNRARAHLSQTDFGDELKRLDANRSDRNVAKWRLAERFQRRFQARVSSSRITDRSRPPFEHHSRINAIIYHRRKSTLRSRSYGNLGDTIAVETRGKRHDAGQTRDRIEHNEHDAYRSRAAALKSQSARATSSS